MHGFAELWRRWESAIESGQAWDYRAFLTDVVKTLRGRRNEIRSECGEWHDQVAAETVRVGAVMRPWWAEFRREIFAQIRDALQAVRQNPLIPPRDGMFEFCYRGRHDRIIFGLTEHGQFVAAGGEQLFLPGSPLRSAIKDYLDDVDERLEGMGDGESDSPLYANLSRPPEFPLVPLGLTFGIWEPWESYWKGSRDEASKLAARVISLVLDTMLRDLPSEFAHAHFEIAHSPWSAIEVLVGLADGSSQTEFWAVQISGLFGADRLFIANAVWHEEFEMLDSFRLDSTDNDLHLQVPARVAAFCLKRVVRARPFDRPRQRVCESPEPISAAMPQKRELNGLYASKLSECSLRIDVAQLTEQMVVFAKGKHGRFEPVARLPISAQRILQAWWRDGDEFSREDLWADDRRRFKNWFHSVFDVPGKPEPIELLREVGKYRALWGRPTDEISLSRGRTLDAKAIDDESLRRFRDTQRDSPDDDVA